MERNSALAYLVATARCSSAERLVGGAEVTTGGGEARRGAVLTGGLSPPTVASEAELGGRGSGGDGSGAWPRPDVGLAGPGGGGGERVSQAGGDRPR